MKHVLLLFMVLITAWASPAFSQQTGETVCIECHREMAGEGFPDVVREWEQSWHYQNRISCHDCHGGDPDDEAAAMSPAKGFVGAPAYDEVPSFCGKCHIGVRDNYLISRHGIALPSRRGPHCLTCHGAHVIQKADVDIINEQLCSRCHPYEKAGIMKKALLQTEKKMQGIDERILELGRKGVAVEDEKKSLFRTQAEFRILFHAADAAAVTRKTGEITSELDLLETKISIYFRELSVRRYFAVAVMSIYFFLAIVLYFLSKTLK